ncbi:SAF domain-containing protein [Synechococcus sp. UW140]|uniref:SAF domain-containing protein n=1 Tax=Synechococcus sp. UW140 TaxID=368503 RepID=UPI0031377370
MDSAFSLEPSELANLVTETNRAWQALGEVRYGPKEAEQKSLVFRRSIYVAEDIAEGELFSTTNIRIVRPGDGATPSFYKQILGLQAKRGYQAGTPLSLKQLL